MLQVSAQYCQLTSSRLTAEPLVMPPKSGSRKRSRYITEADFWDFTGVGQNFFWATYSQLLIVEPKRDRQRRCFFVELISPVPEHGSQRKVPKTLCFSIVI